MLVDAFHAALEDRTEAFDRGGVDGAANVFIPAMVHAVMADELAADLLVGLMFVSHQGGFAAQVCVNDRGNVRDTRAVNVKTAGRTAALNEGQDYVLVGRAKAALLGLSQGTTEIGFVGFNNAAVAAHRRHETASAHCFANAMGQEPRRFVSDTQGTVKLMGANALLAGCHQEERLKP